MLQTYIFHLRFPFRCNFSGSEDVNDHSRRVTCGSHPVHLQVSPTGDPTSARDGVGGADLLPLIFPPKTRLSAQVRVPPFVETRGRVGAASNEPNRNASADPAPGRREVPRVVHGVVS